MSSVATVEHQPHDAAGLWQMAWRRLCRDRVAMLSLCITALFLAAMLAASMSWLASDWNVEVAVSYAPPAWVANPHDDLHAARSSQPLAPPADISDIDPLRPYYQQWRERASALAATQPPRVEQLLFGADQWGRDVLAKTIKGTQVSITVGIGAALIAVLIGTLLGACAGYWRGVIDDALEWFYNVFTAIPYVLLVLAIAAVFSRGFGTLILILGLTGWTGVYRLVRAEYIKHRERPYVLAAQALGASHATRMFTHILPNISHVVLVQYSQHVVQFIKAEVILSFLDLGVPVNSVSWGTMLAEAQQELIIGKWWQLAAAGGSMAILVTALSLLSDALRDALDPRLND